MPRTALFEKKENICATLHATFAPSPEDCAAYFSGLREQLETQMKRLLTEQNASKDRNSKLRERWARRLKAAYRRREERLLEELKRDFADAREHLIDEARKEFLALALNVARSVVQAEFCSNLALTVVRAQQAIEQSPRPPDFLAAHPASVPALEAALSEQNSRAPITVRSDPELPPGAFRLHFGAGTSTIDWQLEFERVAASLRTKNYPREA